MALERLLLSALSKWLPYKPHPHISEEMIAQHAAEFKTMGNWHALMGISSMILFPWFGWELSPWLEEAFYVKVPNALFAFTGEQGWLGLEMGLMLGFAVAFPLSFYLLETYIGSDKISIYRAWYDHPDNYNLDSKALSRIMLWFFLVIMLLVPLSARREYTFVAPDYLLEGKMWSWHPRRIPLSDLQGVEKHIRVHKEDVTEERGFYYRLTFTDASPWESPIFLGTVADLQPVYKQMIEYLAQQYHIQQTEVIEYVTD